MTAWTDCPTFTELVALFEVFAGDNETWREVVRHRANCETCKGNERATAEWREHELSRLLANAELAQPGQPGQGAGPLPMQAVRVYETAGGASQNIQKYWTGEYEGLDNAVSSLSFLGDGDAEDSEIYQMDGE